ncbi:MAG: dUTP diphosphatase [Planctomycetota bacterium]|nr:MAG: dUTP diphosphatase [Planctomycetota bacterium]
MTTTPMLHVRRLDPRAALPCYQTEQAAGMDLAACLPRGECDAETLEIGPGDIVKVPTGIAIALPEGHEGQVRPRSGLATRHGLTVVNAPGTIDADYRGELMVALINLGGRPVRISHGDRIAQLVVAPVSRAMVAVVASLDETERGSGGFGSTGFAGFVPSETREI